MLITLALGRLKQEDLKFQASLSYTASSQMKKKKATTNK
jgi:hypothetical protein